MGLKIKILIIILLTTSISIKSQWTQVGQDINGDILNNLGYSVSLSSDGSIVAIGTIRGGVEAGIVRIFRNVSNNWEQIGEDIDGEEWGDHSGYSVSLNSDGNIVAIGAPDNTVHGSHTGHVRIFENISGNWVQIGEDIDGEDEQNYCGRAVSISADGTIVAVGAMGNNNNGWFAGQVRIFENVSGSWVQMGDDILGEEYSDFGATVSLSSDGLVVAVGAAGGTGSVSVFEYSSGTWSQVGESIYSNLGSQIGNSISLSSDGRVVAVGSPRSEEMGATAGRVQIFKNTDGIWIQLGEDLYGDVYDYFGYSVDLNYDGSRIAIGAAQIDHWLETWGGYVRIFEYVSDSWVQVDEDINAEAIGDNFGWCVSLSSDGNIVAIGAPENDDNFAGSGQVRVYKNSYQGVPDHKDNNVKIFPNPTKGVIVIESKTEKINKICISHISGKRVINKTANSDIVRVDISKLERGVYILDIYYGKTIFSSRIIKN